MRATIPARARPRTPSRVEGVSDGSPTTTGPRTVTATRYVTPLREGGSMPGLVEADDDGLYVLKFRGAGQGPRALVAELVAGELGRALGLAVPEIVLIELDAGLGRAEPDPEIQELIAASGGRNVGIDFLPSALPFVPGDGTPPDPDLAAAIVWFDALTTNVDRTPRNPNLLCWHGRLWLIDHGAALYLQHGTGDLPAVAAVVSAVPGEWLAGDEGEDAARRGYVEYLLRRLEAPREFAEEADAARGR
jgi:hypothetical protein